MTKSKQVRNVYIINNTINITIILYLFIIKSFRGSYIFIILQIKQKAPCLKGA